MLPLPGRPLVVRLGWRAGIQDLRLPRHRHRRDREPAKGIDGVVVVAGQARRRLPRLARRPRGGADRRQPAATVFAGVVSIVAALLHHPHFVVAEASGVHGDDVVLGVVVAVPAAGPGVVGHVVGGHVGGGGVRAIGLIGGLGFINIVSRGRGVPVVGLRFVQDIAGVLCGGRMGIAECGQQHRKKLRKQAGETGLVHGEFSSAWCADLIFHQRRADVHWTGARRAQSASPTRTTSLPKLLPFSRPIKASGAFSRPSTMSSRYLICPDLTQALICSKNSPKRGP